jgi:hypothetical protein
MASAKGIQASEHQASIAQNDCGISLGVAVAIMGATNQEGKRGSQGGCRRGRNAFRVIGPARHPGAVHRPWTGLETGIGSDG